jgi:hypothetical protein
MKAFEGKGVYLWQVPYVANGDPLATADLLNAAKMERVEIKVAQGSYKYRPTVAWGLNVTVQWMRTFRTRFLGKVGGWGFCDGYDTAGEAEIASVLVNELTLDYYIFDAEGVFENRPDIINKTVNMIKLYRDKCDALLGKDVPVGWCTWPLWRSSTGVQWHNIALAQKAVALCDFGMPMVYWSGQGAQAASSYLAKSLLQWKEITTTKSVIPIGRAYVGDGGTADAAGIAAFDQVIRSSRSPGESWWSVQHAVTLPGIWDAVAKLGTWAALPPVEPPITPVLLTDAQKFDIMWTDHVIRHPEYAQR